jgi:hypothetical protein
MQTVVSPEHAHMPLHGYPAMSRELPCSDLR